jgi:hypothetical protein
MREGNMSDRGVADIMQQRIVMLRTMAPGMLIEYDIRKKEGDEYGVITTIDENSGLRGLDFIETEKSWLRQYAMIQYNKAIADGYRVTVIVPDASYLALKERLAQDGTTFIVLNCYGELGITIKA